MRANVVCGLDDLYHTIDLCLTGQYEDLKKAKEDALEECAKERSAHRHYKKECSVLKTEYSNIRLKVQCRMTWF